MEEKYTVIGIEHRSYVSKKTGKNVEGYNLYLTQEVDDKNVLGVRCYSEWLSPEMFSDEIEVGSVVSLGYNRFGRLAKLCRFYGVSADYILGLPKGLQWPR